jgi:hypothetical protein
MEVSYYGTLDIIIENLNFSTQSKLSLFNEDKDDINERAVQIFTQIFDDFAIEDPD